MYGFATMARFSLAEVLTGRVFKTIIVIGVIVNFLVCFMGYWTVSRSPLSDDIIQEQRHGMRHMEGVPDDITMISDSMVLTFVATFLKWFAYAVYIFFGNLLAIFTAIGLMAPELERRSIYTLISKPISRTSILFGKITGMYIGQLVYALIMILSAQLFFLIVGAKFQPTLFPAFGIGFLNFMIFGALAIFLAVHFRQIQSAVIAMMVLWVSTQSGMFFITTVGHEIFKFGKWLDYVILLLPQQKNIGLYALNFIFDKYQQSMMKNMPEMFQLISNDPSNLIQPLIWFGCILIINYLGFFRKEFD